MALIHFIVSFWVLKYAVCSFANGIKRGKVGLQDVNDSHNHNSVLQPCNDKQSQVVDLLQVELHRLNRQDAAPGVAVASTCISNGERLVSIHAI